MRGKALPHHGTGTPVIHTSLVGFGRSGSGQMGLGYRTKGTQDSPIGLLAKDVVNVGIGYGQVVACTGSGDVWVWGLNNSGTLPWAVGPEGKWTGIWEYRNATGKQRLPAQAKLETEGKTQKEVEEKERRLEFPERPEDKRKGLNGQIVYITGHIVDWGGETWIAKRENCATEPGTDETVWSRTPIQVRQFALHAPHGDIWYQYAYNLVMPVKSPQLTGVVQVAMIGGRGIALKANGEVREWGRVRNSGAAGGGFNAGYGKTPRPVKKPNPKSNKFSGTLTTGSRFITNLGGIAEQHNSAGNFDTTYAQAKKVESPILMVEGGPAGVVPAGAEIERAITEEVAEAITEIGSLNEAVPSTTGNIFQIVTTPLTAAVKTKDKIVLNDLAGHNASFEVGANASIGAESVLLVGQVPNFPYPIGTKVYTGKPYASERRRVVEIELTVPATGNYTGTLLVKKPPKEQTFMAVSEGPLMSAGWPIVPDIPAGVKCVAVAIGDKAGATPFSLALTNEGKVLTWGQNGSGILGQGLGTNGEILSLVPNYVVNTTNSGPLTNIIAIACGEQFCLALDEERRVYIWGSLAHGLGGIAAEDATELATGTPRLVTGLPVTPGGKPEGIAGAASTGYVLCEDGKIFAFGNNEKGECGNGTVGGKENAPWKANKTYSSPNKVYDHGFNYKATASVPPVSGKLSEALSTGGAITTLHVGALAAAIPSGLSFTLASEKHTQVWVASAEAIKGAFTISVVSQTPNFAYPLGAEFINSRPGEDSTHWVAESHPAQPVPAEVITVPAAKAVSGGRYHAAAVTRAGDLYTWGANTDGQIGNGSDVTEGDQPHGTPFHVPLEGKHAITVECGEWDTIAILEGAEAVSRIMTMKLFPETGSSGELVASSIRFDILSNKGTSGWRFKYNRQPTPEAEVELAALLVQLEEELVQAENEGTKEEEEEAIAELEKFKTAQTEAEESGSTTLSVTPTEILPGKLRFEFKPTGVISPIIGYIVRIQRQGDATWKELIVNTNGIWQSPYAF